MCKKKERDSEETLENYDEIDCLIERDIQYTILLKQYIKAQRDNEEQQRRFKNIFFTVTMLIFVLVVFLGIASIYIISKKTSITIADVGVAFAGLGSIISVIIILPSKIADNLFPATANKEMLEIVRTMQNYDLNSDVVNDTDVQSLLG